MQPLSLVASNEFDGNLMDADELKVLSRFIELYAPSALPPFATSGVLNNIPCSKSFENGTSPVLKVPANAGGCADTRLITVT